MRKRLVVIGAGLGGLATALRMAHRGHDVLVLEKTGEVGGRCKSVAVGDCRFDGGPTLLMMLDPFRKLFADVGERFEDHVPIELCDPSYRVFYADGSRIDGTPNVALMTERIAALAGERDALAYPGFLGAVGTLYQDSVPHFVRKNFYAPLDYLTPRQLSIVLRHRMVSNLARRVERHFEDPRLRMLFSFQTMYLGLSPFDAPWVYAVLAFMEYGQGIWYPRGGTAAIPRAVAALAEARGVEIRLNTEVSRVEGKSVVLTSGDSIEADAIVCNADLPYAERELLRRPRKPRRSSCSAYMMYFDFDGELPALLHHNVFFGRDFKGNLDQIFHRLEIPDDPAFYACLSRQSEPALAPPGRENLYLLVPCPNLDRPWTEADRCALESRVLERLKRDVGFDPANIVAKRRYTPVDWSRDLNLDRGAAFGLSHDFFQSAFFRPANRSRDNERLYYVGASTVPGNGLPMVLISAELAEERLVREQGF
jgi:phytoene desaturase